MPSEEEVARLTHYMVCLGLDAESALSGKYDEDWISEKEEGATKEAFAFARAILSLFKDKALQEQSHG
jgi:hypothetical protein